MRRLVRMKTDARPKAGMTCVSRTHVHSSPSRGLNALAWCSLLVSTVGASACFNETPTYTVPGRSTPIILGTQVDPPTVEVRKVSLGFEQALSVPFQSIDAGEGLFAIFWHDLATGMTQDQINTQLLTEVPIDPDSRPLEEQDRTVSFTWPATPAGCRTVTMALSHATNFSTPFVPPKDPSAVAQVTWFFDVRDPSTPTAPPCWSAQ
jgi:hypothetical protein